MPAQAHSTDGNTSVERTRSGAGLVKKNGSTMQEIVKSVERVTEVIAEISTGAREQSEGITQINTAVTELDNVTQRNAALVAQTNAAARNMRAQAERLRALIASFKLSSDATQTADAAEQRARVAPTAETGVPRRATHSGMRPTEAAA